MKKFIFCVTILLFSVHVSSASYFEVNGAEMSYKYIGNRYYEIKLNVYTRCPDNPGDSLDIRISSPTGNINSYIVRGKALDLGEVTLDCGHGSSQICKAIDSFRFSARKWTAIIVVQLSKAACEYTFSWSAAKRNFIITTGPALQPFYIESYINICDQEDVSSPEFVVKPYFLNKEQTCLSVPNTFYDNTKSANVSYFAELVQPMCGSGLPVYYHSPNNYMEPITTNNMGMPDDLNKCLGFYCNPNTADLHFVATNLSETTPVAIRVTKYLNKKMVSRITRDFNISTVLDNVNHAPFIQTENGLKACEVNAGDSIKIKITTFDADPGDSITLWESDSMKGSSFYIEDKSRLWPTGIFVWKPKLEDFRDQPYILTLYAKDNVKNCEQISANGQSKKIIYVWVRSRKSDVIPIKSVSKFKLFPIPTHDRLSIEGFKERPSKVIVNDITGKTMEVSTKWDGALLNINTSQLAKGEYIIRVISSTDITCESFIKE